MDTTIGKHEDIRQHEPADPTWLCILLAGIGGTLPTLSRLAASLIGTEKVELPEASFYVGLVIYFVIGAVMCCAMKERALKSALYAGIAAPAVIVSGAYGLHGEKNGQRASDRQTSPPVVVQPPADARRVGMGLLDLVVTPAHAGNDRAARVQTCLHEPSSGATAPTAANVYSYKVHIDWNGATGWDMGTSNAWTLRVTCTRGEVTFALEDLQSFAFETTRPVTRVQLDPRRGTLRTLSLPANEGGTIQLKMAIETKKDIFWALGGQGVPRVRSFAGAFVPVR